MVRPLVLAAALALAPAALVAQQQDTTHHADSSAIAKKSRSTVDNAGEGVKQANDQVDNGAYKVGTGVKNLFRGKPKKKPATKPDSTAVRDSVKRDSTKRDSTPH